jgi:hypothetical protein
MVTVKSPHCSTCGIMIIDGDKSSDAINRVPTVVGEIGHGGIQADKSSDAINRVPTLIGHGDVEATHRVYVVSVRDQLYSIVEELYRGGGNNAAHI